MCKLGKKEHGNGQRHARDPRSGSEQISTLDFCQFASAPILDKNLVPPAVLLLAVPRFTDMLPLFLASVLCRIIVVERGSMTKTVTIGRGHGVAMFRRRRALQVCFLPPGENPLHVTPLPSGTCSYCCPIEMDRDIEYLLFTRRNPTDATTLNISDPNSLRRSNFNDRYPTVIFIHGYSESATGRSAVTIRDVYLKRGEYNLILVNWAKLAGLPWYVTAVRNTRIVGPRVARLVNWLDAQGAVSLPNLHVIGFSLGAEVAGFMGKALAPRKVGRITGLDAAYPLYMNTGSEGHLTKSDAMFVDVIHTDGGNFGFPNPLGHVDFYPNGGRPVQPGCDLENVFQRSLSRLINQYSMIPSYLPTVVGLAKIYGSDSTAFDVESVVCPLKISREASRKRSLESIRCTGLCSDVVNGAGKFPGIR
ncbi:Hepatic triacylglycerol lipase [Eufriesea mexicana]|uniref:phospholipase A1 n=1 Tax=Eufriesea mexicana TaxID=516756 RepID=A0A310SLN1_9HYME|nr:Hepatic triacylglycerol lipase [Eufriesea mexicana]